MEIDGERTIEEVSKRAIGIALLEGEMGIIIKSLMKLPLCERQEEIVARVLQTLAEGH